MLLPLPVIHCLKIVCTVTYRRYVGVSRNLFVQTQKYQIVGKWLKKHIPTTSEQEEEEY
jgi:hypothetical protein